MKNYFVIGSTKMDNTGRINIKSVLPKEAKEIGAAYLVSEGVLYLRLDDNTKDGDGANIGGSFKWPVAKLDAKGRFVLPSCLRKFVSTGDLGIGFDGGYLVLIPFDLPEVEDRMPKQKEKQMGLPSVF